MYLKINIKKKGNSNVMKLILKSKTFILFLCFLFAALFFLIPTISNCSTDNNKIHYFYVEQNSGSQFSNTVLPGGAAQEII